MKWTNKKPKEQGWYWYEDRYFGPAPVKVEWTGFIDDSINEGVRQLDITWPEDDCNLPEFDEADGKWSEQIEQPEE